MTYGIEEQLDVPLRFFSRSLPADVLRLFDIDPAKHQQPEPMTVLRLQGAGGLRGHWRVTTYLGTRNKLLQGKIVFEEGTTREDVLPQAREWVRASYPLPMPWGKVVEIPVNVSGAFAQANSDSKLAVDGLILVGKKR